MIAPLHILTACSRPEGLPAIAQAIAVAPPSLRIVWHVAFDTAREHVGGQAVKNRLIDGIDDEGWIWICDDDNAPLPGFFDRLATLPSHPFLLFGQQRQSGYQPPTVPQIGVTDVAQAVVQRHAIGRLRLPEAYDGDGQWLCAIHAKLGNAVMVNEPLTAYNAQRWLCAR